DHRPVAVTPLCFRGRVRRRGFGLRLQMRLTAPQRTRPQCPGAAGRFFPFARLMLLPLSTAARIAPASAKSLGVRPSPSPNPPAATRGGTQPMPPAWGAATSTNLPLDVEAYECIHYWQMKRPADR